MPSLPLPSLSTLLLILPPTLLIYILSLLLHKRPIPSHDPSSSSTPPADTLPSLLLPLTTTHLRLLPIPARHAFRYPLLYFGLDLSSLESHSLSRSLSYYPSWAPRPWGLRLGVFEYETEAEKAGNGGRGRKGWTVAGLEEGSYLAPTSPSLPSPDETSEGKAIPSIDRSPLRTKLSAVLSSHLYLPLDDVSSRLGSIYLVTMPAFLGKEGINPLSVWFCYEKLSSPIADETRGKEGEKARSRVLWTVVLEVHNTFGERHVYVLEVGKGEDVKPIGYQHRWTFPRNFHVSPFNSRNGFYTLSLNAPFTTTTTSSSFPPPSGNTSPSNCIPSLDPTLSISLLLLTPSRRPKLHARLATTPSSSSDPSQPQHTALPFTSRNILVQCLWKFPVALLSTTPRILWNAGVLAWGKKLKMYGRPEPVREAWKGETGGEDEGGMCPAGEDIEIDEGEDSLQSSPMSSPLLTPTSPLPSYLAPLSPLSESESKRERDFSQLDNDEPWGHVQTDPRSQPGGIFSRPVPSSELFSRLLAIRYLKSQLTQLNNNNDTSSVKYRVVIPSSHPSLPTVILPSSGLSDDNDKFNIQTLILTPHSLHSFTLLLLSPTLPHALYTLDRPFPHSLLSPSSHNLFLKIFTPSSLISSATRPSPSSPNWGVSLTRLVRSYNPLSPPSVRRLSSSSSVSVRAHWIEDSMDKEESWRLAKVLASVVFAEWLEGGIISALRVGFVEGGEGWRGTWRRSEEGERGRH